MKNNKGFTLVELLVTIAILGIVLVEVFAMMQNSSKLYMNGTYEVALQTEAQQIVQQLENLLVDANCSISTNYDASVSSDIITISNNEAVYIIKLVKSDPTRTYGDLFLTKNDLTGGTSVTDLPMAEYVESVSLNMANYTQASSVTLDIKLQNEEYSYQASEDIYLRNDIGVSTSGIPSSSSSAYLYELKVLRFKEYDLSALYDTDTVQYQYQFEGGTMNNATYQITGSAGAFNLECTSVMNNSDDAGPEYVIDAINPTTHTREFGIKVTTDKILVGNNGYGLIYSPAGETNFKLTSFIDVKGISVDQHDVHSITATYYYVVDGTVIQTTPLNISAENMINNSSPSFRIDKVQFQNDSTVNCTIISAERLMNRDNYYNGFVNKGIAKIVVTYSYDGGRPDVIVTGYVYPSVQETSQMMSPIQADALWRYCIK